MAKSSDTGRTNQRHRTRKDLLHAAARLLKQGQAPDMDQVAAEAMVSRATAYRYFPSVEALLVEAPLEGAAPDPQELFAGDQSTDPVARVDKADSALSEMTHRNEHQLRLMLAASMERAAKGTLDGIPIRQNRRTALIETALAPARDRFTSETYKKLCAGLALVLGTESMIVFKDVLRLDEKTGRKVKSWMIKALVRVALEESGGRR